MSAPCDTLETHKDQREAAGELLNALLGLIGAVLGRHAWALTHRHTAAYTYTHVQNSKAH